MKQKQSKDPFGTIRVACKALSKIRCKCMPKRMSQECIDWCLCSVTSTRNLLTAASPLLQPHLHKPGEHVMLNDDCSNSTPLCPAITSFLDWKQTMAFQLTFRLKFLTLKIDWIDSWEAFVSWAAVCQLGCYVCCQIQNCQLRCTPFSPSVCQPVCKLLALRNAVSNAEHCHLVCGSALHFVSPAAVCQLSCIKYSVFCQLRCCNDCSSAIHLL